MATITSCASTTGRVTTFISETPAPVLITFDYPIRSVSGNTVTYTPNPQPLRQLGIAIGFELQQEVAAQFQPTLDADIYVTPFGDRPGAIRIDFLANRQCTDTEETLSIIDRYLAMRLLPTRGSTPETFFMTPRQTVTVGRAAFTGYITKLAYQASTAQQIDIRGSLFMTAWPA